MSGPNPPGDEPAREPVAEELTDTGFARAYSAPESEQYAIAPYVAAEPGLYDYDAYVPGSYAAEAAAELPPPRWPWVVGVTAIIAAIALVASVSLLVTRTDSAERATPATTTPPAPPPVQDEIIPPPPPPPPPPTSEPPPPPPPAPPAPPQTATVAPEPPPPPAPEPAPPPAPEPPPETPEPPPAPPPVPAGPRQVTYSVTGTKAPGDIITVTYTDASGRQRTQRNVYIPWSLTVTPISASDVGSVRASSLFLVSRLNCSITTSDGTVLSSNQNNAAQTNC
jgi:hypothetical protein